MVIPRESHSDLPFIVTQWLHSYSISTNSTQHDVDANISSQALKDIYKATTLLANSFHRLGAYGHSPITLSSTKKQAVNTVHDHSSYSDLSRKYSHAHGPCLLDILAQKEIDNDSTELNCKVTPFALIHSILEYSMKSENTSNFCLDRKLFAAKAERHEIKKRLMSAKGESAKEHLKKKLDESTIQIEKAQKLMENNFRIEENNGHQCGSDRHIGYFDVTSKYHVVVSDRPHYYKKNISILLEVLTSRLRHAQTISCHLNSPIYCLRFDRTGSYFITGADDNLVRLFRLGTALTSDVGSENYHILSAASQIGRGAVLVTTLRGHLGEVTDIDISMDNSLLATASVDGHVRIWFLKDGLPFVVLRHDKIVNFVEWSNISPYILASCGEDGLQVWDVSRGGDIHSDVKAKILTKVQAGHDAPTIMTYVSGFFATGHISGKVKVWRESKGSNSVHEYQVDLRKESPIHPLELVGHMSRITELHFSNHGDRLLSASGQEGKVAVWSLFGNNRISQVRVQSSVCEFRVEIKRLQLIDPSGNDIPTKCDCATWTCDDRNIVTSQSTPSTGMHTSMITANTINVWDSISGKCLLVILSSHGSLCEVLAPHPTLPSVLAIAGADGVVKVWNLDQAYCFFSHSNILSPPHQIIHNNRTSGKLVGYAEAQWSPEGSELVLSDQGEIGRAHV